MKKIYCFEFNKGFIKEKRKIEDSYNVKNILKEKMSDIAINLNFSVGFDSCCNIISKTKSKFIVSVEGNVTISEEGDDENIYSLGEGFHKFEINNNKSVPHIKNCLKNISIKNWNFKEELLLHNGFYLLESDNPKITM